MTADATDDELKPLTTAGGIRSIDLALVILFAGGAYCLVTVPVSLGVIVLRKVDLTPLGFSKESMSRCQIFYWIGWAVASALILPLVDRLGRKRPYFVLLAIGLVVTVVSTRVHSEVSYSICMFLIGASFNPAALVGYLLMQESIPENMWSTSTVIANVGFGVSSILVALIGGTLTRHVAWRLEMLEWHIPYLLVLLIGPFVVSESPQFTKGESGADRSDERKPAPLALLCCSSLLRGRMVATVICWVACTVGFYGLSYSSGNLSDGPYTNLVLLSLVDIVGYGLAGTIIKILSVKPSQMMAFTMGLVSLVICAWLPPGTGRVVFALCGRLFLNVAFTTVYLLVLECFPPACRGTATGIANFFSRLSGLMTPMFSTYRISHVSLVMGLLCLVAVLATWTLPGAVQQDKASGSGWKDKRAEDPAPGGGRKAQA